MRLYTWLQYAATHKPNIWGYYRWQWQRVSQSEIYYQMVCEKISCDHCGFREWCYYEPWTQKLRYKIQYMPYAFREKISGPIFTWYWRRFKKGKSLICSVCGWQENLQKFSFQDSAMRRVHGKWICHHCDCHQHDDWINGKGEVSHEEYEEYWKEQVKEHNERLK